MINDRLRPPGGEKKRILFVDDEENVLTGLKRTVHAMRHEWHASFAISGQQALQILDEEAFDVVVSDMRMPGMDGAELLSEISSEYPQMIRILLSGQSDLASFIGSACPAHQFLAKPCDVYVLKRTIKRAISLHSLLNNETLRGIIMQMNTLPSPPTMYVRIEQELSQKDSSMQRIGQIIGEDIAMTAKLLQLVNSPFFGLNRNIESPAQAASLLGVNMVQFIMLHMQTFAIPDPAMERVIAQISEHCMLVATLAREIAKSQGESPECYLDAYLGGMMHDLGRLILAVNMPEKYRVIAQQTESSQSAWQVEQQQTGVTHAEIGAYLLALWGLPEIIVEIVLYHHRPASCSSDDFFALTAVHVADVLINNPKLQQTRDEICLDEAYLGKLGLGDRIADWQVCAKEMMEKHQ